MLQLHQLLEACKPKFSVLGVHGSIKSPKAEGADIHRAGKEQFLMGVLRNEKLWQEDPLLKCINMGLGPRAIKSGNHL